MKRTYSFFLVCLLLLVGCTISDTEQQGLDDVQKMYGGRVSFRIGTQASTNAKQPQGKVFRVQLTDADLSRYGGNLELPAANAALLVYQRMTPDEQADYGGVQVEISNGGSSRTFGYKMPLLARGIQAYGHLKILLDGWRQQDYQTVADRWNQAALIRPDRAPLVGVVARQGEKIGPIASFSPEGFLPVEIPVNGKTEQLMNVFASVKAPDGGIRPLLFCLNPDLPASGQFLYGLEFLQPQFRSAN